MDSLRRWGWLGSVLVLGGWAVSTQLQIALPPERKDANLVRDGAVYLLDGVAAQDGDLQKTSWNIDASELPTDFLKALGRRDTAGEVYSAFKLESFRDFYRDLSRQRFHRKLEIPATLTEFEQRYPFRDRAGGFSQTVVELSQVKKAKRIIYRSPSRLAEMSIAQTVVEDAAQAESVRETEVIIRREGGDDFDFFVYSSQGALVTESEFTSGTGKKIVAPVPITCMACHYDPGTRTFGRENNLHF